jgi:hypothetical protein
MSMLCESDLGMYSDLMKMGEHHQAFWSSLGEAFSGVLQVDAIIRDQNQCNDEA